MKPIVVKASTCIESDIGNNDKDTKFKVGDHVRISKCKSILAKGNRLNWSEEGFGINTLPWTYTLLLI